MNCVYVPVTIGLYRGDCRLADVDCEARVEYELPDGPSGVLDWDVTAFHFTGSHNGARVFAELGRSDPLFRELYANMDAEWIHDNARETLAADGICDLYLDPDA